jgi:Ser/Thr protein kinase RdoA (MazF antagonist)
MEEKKYTYSQLSALSAGRQAALHYDLPEQVLCKYYVLGLHDNYLLESDSGKYILRIYRNAWRSEQEARFELELLAFLGNNNAPVAFPLPTNSGELAFSIDSPEGKRTAALFHYADGRAPGNDICVEESALLGQAVANAHQVMDKFDASNTRPLLDMPYLLDQSIEAIAPFIDAEAKSFLKTLQGKLHRVLPRLPQEPGVYGICIGDVNPTNFHINGDKLITLFDFDQCGYGYRAFEIGKFISSIQPLKTKQQLAEAFIDGYQEVRRLSQAEVDAIPYFEIVSHIWVMAIHAYNADRIGHKWLEKPFWDRRLAILKELDKVLG